MKREGKYIRSFIDTDGNQVNVFEYRGYQYETINSGWKGGHQPMYEQHKMEQDHIDELIEMESKRSNNTNIRPAEEGFELFWKLVEENS